MTEQEPQCDYCGEKAVKTVHGYADNDGTPTDHYFVKNMIKSIILSGELIRHRISTKIQCRLFLFAILF